MTVLSYGFNMDVTCGELACWVEWGVGIGDSGDLKWISDCALARLRTQANPCRHQAVAAFLRTYVTGRGGETDVGFLRRAPVAWWWVTGDPQLVDFPKLAWGGWA